MDGEGRTVSIQPARVLQHFLRNIRVVPIRAIFIRCVCTMNERMSEFCIMMYRTLWPEGGQQPGSKQRQAQRVAALLMHGNEALGAVDRAVQGGITQITGGAVGR